MRPGSLRTRLTLLFFAVTLLAVAAVFFYVTPQLDSSLREQKLRSLSETADAFTPLIADVVVGNGTARQIDRIVKQVADRSSTRVTLLLVGGNERELQLPVVADSTSQAPATDLRFAIGARVVRARRTATGTESGETGQVAQVAEPITEGGVVNRVVVFSSPLSEVQGIVALLRRQILVAGALGLLVALIGGFVVSRTITRRVAALEEGAEKVARGDFTAHFGIDRDDELGQLARALDAMQRQLGELEYARKRFVAIASHELRTPIFSLSGFLELLADEDLDEETRTQFLAAIREQVSRLGKLATDLLDLSKLEAGSLELRPERTDVRVLVKTVTAEFVPALHQHGSALDLRLADERIDAVCDPERVAQVLRILIDNALTHTPPGTDLAVSATRSDGVVRLAVTDGGPGIERDAVARVFEPFFTSDDAQGSGLGLAIARELAERMNGSLRLDPTPGRTTFSLELPA